MVPILNKTGLNAYEELGLLWASVGAICITKNIFLVSVRSTISVPLFD